MIKGLRHVWFAGCVLALLLPSSAWAVPTFDMIALRVNGTPIYPSNDIPANPGDVIEVWMRFAGWSEQGNLIGYQIKFNGDSLQCEGNGGALTLTEVPCDENSDCFGVSLCEEDGYCDCFGSVYIDDDNTAYVFYGEGVIVAVDCDSPAAQNGFFKLGAAKFTGGGIEDPGWVVYVGTIFLQVPEDACGDYTVRFVDSPFDTFGRLENMIPVDPLDSSATLVIRTEPCVSECGEGTVTFDDPVDGFLDALQPHNVNSTTPLQGIDTFEVTAPSGDESCWALCETNNNPAVHPGLAANVISNIVDNGDGTHTITLDRPIAHGEVTTLTYESDSAVVTTGTFYYMPADANADGTSAPADVLAVIDSLNGVTPLPASQVDMDRDGTPAPADILRVIDLLNGANAFEPFVNVTIDETGCP